MMASETKPTNRALTVTEPRRNGRPMRIARNDAGKAVRRSLVLWRLRFMESNLGEMHVE